MYMAHLACLKKKADDRHTPFLIYLGKVTKRSLGTVFKTNASNAKKNETPSSMFRVKVRKTLNVGFILKFSMLNVFSQL